MQLYIHGVQEYGSAKYGVQEYSIFLNGENYCCYPVGHCNYTEGYTAHNIYLLCVLFSQGAVNEIYIIMCIYIYVCVCVCVCGLSQG